MRALLIVCRIIFGSVFLLSGVLKILDPIGTSLIVSEYLRVAHLSFFSFFSIPFGILLSLTELLTGLAILVRVRMKFFAIVGFYLISFFTVLTLFLAIFNPISDCGCFGEAVHLTNWQTFLKNIVLLLAATPIYLFRNKFKLLMSKKGEYIYVSVFAFIALLIPLRSLIVGPFIEFSNFSVGTNIASLYDEAQENTKYETLFTYKKDDMVEDFSIQNLPDSTWSYIDSKTKLVGDASVAFDLSILDMNEGDITTSIVESRDQMLICSVYNSKFFKNDANWDKIKKLSEKALAEGAVFYIFSNTIKGELEEIADQKGILNVSFGYMDYKNLITLHRINGGIVYLTDGVIVKKWPGLNYPFDKISKELNEDYEIVSMSSEIRKQIAFELLLFIILVSMIVIRRLSKILPPTNC